MFGSNYFGQPHFGQGYPERSVVFDNASSSGYEASLSTYSWTHVTGLSARAMFVNVSIFATGTVSTITYNGVSLALIRADAQGVYRNEIWYLANPAYGSHSVQVNLSTSLTSIASAASYGNVDQNTPYDVAAGTNAIGGTPALSLTPVSNYGWIMSGITTSDATITPTAQTQRANNSGALGTDGIADVGPINPIASTAVNWSAVGGLDSWALGAIAINPYEDVGSFIVSHTATLSFSGGNTKKTNRATSATLSFSGAFIKLISRPFTGTLSFVGAVSRTITYPVTATLSFVGLINRKPSRTLTGTLSFSGASSKQTSRVLTATLSFSGSIVRQLARTLTGTLSFVGAFNRQNIRAFTGTLSFSGTVSRTVSHVLTATLSFSGKINRSISRTLTGTLNFSGALTRTIARVFSGVLSFSGNLTDLLTLIFSATLSFSGAIVRNTSRSLSATLDFSGSIFKTITRTLSGTLNFTGAFLKKTILPQAATLTFGGSFGHVVNKNFTAALSFSGTVLRIIYRNLNATLSFSGALEAILIKVLGTKNLVWLTDGTPALIMHSNQKLYVTLLDGRRALKIGPKLYMVI